MEKEFIKIYIQAFINEYINQCFRDQADKDYLSARLCYKYELLSNFYWLAQQCLEKYLKAILLYQRINTLQVGHEISKAILIVEKQCPQIDFLKWDFKLKQYSLKKETAEKYIARIERLGLNRYGSYNTTSYGDELYKLDAIVWLLTSFCQSGNLAQMPCGGPVLTSFLGDVYRNKNSYRKILMWNNICFGKQKRRIPLSAYGQNNPINGPFIRANSPVRENKEIAIGIGEFILKNIKLENDIKREIQAEVNKFKESLENKQG